MALTYDLTKIAPEVKFIGEDGAKQLSVVTEAMIFATMAVGIGTITEENAAEFFARVRLSEILHGAMRWDGEGKPLRFSSEDVRNHIGLSTNVSFETWGKWRSRLLDNIKKELASEFQKGVTA